MKDEDMLASLASLGLVIFSMPQIPNIEKTFCLAKIIWKKQYNKRGKKY
jgi:hypothetical protein